MNKYVNKIENIFKLSDLEFSKAKDVINEGLNDKLNEISEEFVKANTFQGSRHIQVLLNERIRKIKIIVDKRINLDLHYIEKGNFSFNDEIYQSILKRTSKTIEFEIQSAREKMLNMCRRFASPKDYTNLINRRLDNEKNILISNAKRDIQIHEGKNDLGTGEFVVSKSQKEDYKKYKYKWHYRINIIERDKNSKRENSIEIDGNGIELGNNSFILFLRLTKELKSNMEGWLDIEEFVREVDLTFTGRHQLIDRLRNSLLKISFLDKGKVKELIENKKGGFYRISNHPDFIKFGKEQLMQIDEGKIKDIIKQLSF